MSDLFLNREELVALTGYRHAPSQIAALRKSGIAHYINGRGKPLVPRALIESGGKTPKPKPPAWQPLALRQT